MGKYICPACPHRVLTVTWSELGLFLCFKVQNFSKFTIKKGYKVYMVFGWNGLGQISNFLPKLPFCHSKKWDEKKILAQ